MDEKERNIMRDAQELGVASEIFPSDELCEHRFVFTGAGEPTVCAVCDENLDDA